MKFKQTSVVKQETVKKFIRDRYPYIEFIHGASGSV